MRDSYEALKKEKYNIDTSVQAVRSVSVQQSKTATPDAGRLQTHPCVKPQPAATGAALYLLPAIAFTQEAGGGQVAALGLTVIDWIIIPVVYPPPSQCYLSNFASAVG